MIFHRKLCVCVVLCFTNSLLLSVWIRIRHMHAYVYRRVPTASKTQSSASALPPSASSGKERTAVPKQSEREAGLEPPTLSSMAAQLRESSRRLQLQLSSRDASTAARNISGESGATRNISGESGATWSSSGDLARNILGESAPASARGQRSHVPLLIPRQPTLSLQPASGTGTSIGELLWESV